MARFVRRHLWHLLLLAPGAALVTVLHEAAHAGVVVLQGGTVRSFQWLPAGTSWGSVSYTFPAGMEPASLAVSIAPYAGWLVLAGLTTVVAFRRPPRAPAVASVWFVWGFLIPLADIGNAAFPWLQGLENDFADAWGSPSVAGRLAVAGMAALCVAWGFPVQGRLYGDGRLRLPAYLGLSLATVTGLMALSLGLRRLA